MDPKSSDNSCAPEILRSSVKPDEISLKLAQAFDYKFDGSTSFELPRFELPAAPFGIGLIVGPSGSGKSTILKRIAEQKAIHWDPALSVCAHFSSSDEAAEKLAAVGFNSIPSWLKPRHVLSTGEGFRADLARQICDGATFDEFTSVVDRTVAKSCSVALRRYVDAKKINGIVLATCHYDVIEWLQPDWVFDTATGEILPRGSLRPRPKINLVVERCSAKLWGAFHSHHYLDEKINKSARCWLATWDDVPVAFGAALSFPNGHFQNAWRGHRTVVLPDFQGLGIGVRLSDAIAKYFVDNGGRYFSKTAHSRMGGYRENSPLWKPTSKNKMARADYSSDRKTKESAHKIKHVTRVCWSHEFIGVKKNEH